MKLVASLLFLAATTAGQPEEPVDRVADALARGISASGPARVAAPSSATKARGQWLAARM